MNEMEGNNEEALRLAKQAGELNEARIIKEYILLLEKSKTVQEVNRVRL